MIVAQNKPPVLPARLPSPPPAPSQGPEQAEPSQQPEQPQSPPPSRGEVFFRSSASCARTLAQVGGFSNGASVGYLGGALIAGSRGTSGTVALGLAVAGAALGGAVGWKVMGKFSDWAAQVAHRIAPHQGLKAEAAGRVALNLAVDMLSGSPVTAAVDLSVTAAWGTYQSLRRPTPPPTNPEA